MKQKFDAASIRSSKIVTNIYSTSFSIGIGALGKRLRNPIYAIYGFVRFADEIVDSFEGYKQAELLARFEQETFTAIEEGISLNPILNSYQQVVNDYQIDHELIHQFLNSMKMDLSGRVYDDADYDKYIFGSAEVVGLMCLRVFCNGDDKLYEELTYSAKKLGSAFQKINFLRDLHADYYDLKRLYFPNIKIEDFNAETKKKIEQDIQLDFEEGLKGISLLPADARFGTYIAYRYYKELFKKAKKTSAQAILKKRVRVPNGKKYAIFFESALKHSFGLI